MAGYDRTSVAADERPQANALLTFDTKVDDAWIDYNGHMTEWQYYRMLSDSGENFLRALGFTEEYRAKGYSFFSVEGHLRNLKECRAGTPLRVYTEMLGYDHVRLHIYQYIFDMQRDIVIATGEHMLLHVDLRLRRAAAMLPEMSRCMELAFARWHPLVRPRGSGSHIRETGPS